MTVGRKIVLGYTAILVLLLVVVIVGSYTVVMLKDGYQRLLDVPRMLSRSSMQLLANLNSQVAGSRGIMLFPAERTSLRDALVRDQHEAATLLQTMQRLAPTDEGLRLLTDISAANARQVEVRSRVIGLALADRTDEAAAVAAQELRPVESEISNLVGRFLLRQAEREAAARADLEATTAQLSALRFSVFALALVGGIVLATTLSRSITRQLRDAVAGIGAAAAEILAVTSEVASSSAETAAAVSQTTTTVDQIKQTAQLSMSKARSVSGASQHTAETGRAGSAAVNDVVAGMGRINLQVESVAETIVRLAEQTQAIGEIIATVNDIADQTNLLAVNASIEAARAGEHGHGFTVVAEEVRRLADQSKRATATVREILGAISKTVGSAVMATEQASKTAQTGATQATESGEAIRDLAEAISAAAEAAFQITVSSQQQLAGMDQVATAMASIQQATQQNVSGTRQAEQAAQNLGQLGRQLRDMVGG